MGQNIPSGTSTHIQAGSFEKEITLEHFSSTKSSGNQVIYAWIYIITC